MGESRMAVSGFGFSYFRSFRRRWIDFYADGGRDRDLFDPALFVLPQRQTDGGEFSFAFGFTGLSGAVHDPSRYLQPAFLRGLYFCALLASGKTLVDLCLIFYADFVEQHARVFLFRSVCYFIVFVE